MMNSQATAKIAEIRALFFLRKAEIRAWIPLVNNQSNMTSIRTTEGAKRK